MSEVQVAAADPDLAGAAVAAKDRVAAELAPGERLAWVGRPRVGRRLRDLGMPFVAGVVGTGLLGFALAVALGGGEPRTAAGVILAGGGGGGLAFGAVVALLARHAGGTRYAITDRRAIVRTPRLGRGVRVASYGPAALAHVTPAVRPDGSGDLKFASGPGANTAPAHGFMAIDDVHRVHARLRRTLLGERPGPTEDDATGGRGEGPLGVEPDDPAEAIRAGLVAGERLVWVGRRRPEHFPAVLVATARWLLFGCGLVWVVVGGVELIIALIERPWSDLAAVAAITAPGLPMLAAPFLRHFSRRPPPPPPDYAITDRRAIVAEPAGRGKTAIRSYDARALANLQFESLRDGTGAGHLIFDRRPSGDDTVTTGFLAVADARRVEALLRRTLLDPASLAPSAAPPDPAPPPGAAPAAKTDAAKPPGDDFAGSASFGWDAPIRAALAPGERLLWLGRADPWRSALATWPIVPFGLPWFGFAWWAWARSRVEAQAPLSAVAACFGLIGLVVCGGVLQAFWSAVRGGYALTDRRVLFCDPRSFGDARVRGRDRGAIADLLRRERPDGSGDLVFDRLGADRGEDALAGRGFLAIADVRRVEDSIRSAKSPE